MLRNIDHHCDTKYISACCNVVYTGSDLVGREEQSSAKLRATHWIKIMATIQPHAIPRIRFSHSSNRSKQSNGKTNIPAVPA